MLLCAWGDPTAETGADQVGEEGSEQAPLSREEVGPRSFDAFGLLAR